MTAEHPQPNERIRRRNITLAVAAAIVLLLVLGAGIAVGVAGLGTGGASNRDAAPTGNQSSESARPVPTAQPTAAPVITGPNPQSCDQLYSARMTAALKAQGPLNDETLADETGTRTPALEPLLSGLPGLKCTWGQAGEFAIITDVKQVTAEQSAAALAAMKKAGFSCYAETGGTRCVTQDNLESGSVGESHFLRENVWLSTAWVNWPQAGYTADMVATLWS